MPTIYLVDADTPLTADMPLTAGVHPSWRAFVERMDDEADRKDAEKEAAMRVPLDAQRARLIPVSQPLAGGGNYMKKKFVVIYDWGNHDSTYHEFDTFEEALKDRLDYSNPEKYPIYQLVEVKSVYSLPDGTIVEQAG